MSVIIEKETLQVCFSKEKLTALKFYMDEKDTTVEKELQNYIKNIYEKYVPAATRRYLDRNDSPEELQAEVDIASEAEQQETASIATHTRGRRRNSRNQTEDVNEGLPPETIVQPEENQEQVEGEVQGMTMSM